MSWNNETGIISSGKRPLIGTEKQMHHGGRRSTEHTFAGVRGWQQRRAEALRRATNWTKSNLVRNRGKGESGDAHSNRDGESKSD